MVDVIVVLWVLCMFWWLNILDLMLMFLGGVNVRF